jgi:hypothetical protein
MGWDVINNKVIEIPKCVKIKINKTFMLNDIKYMIISIKEGWITKDIISFNVCIKYRKETLM